MLPPARPWSREEMMKRIAFFKDLKGHKTGLADSHLPECERELLNVIGFKPPKAEEDGHSPVGADASAITAIDIFEGFNLGFVKCKEGCGPLMHNHDTNETFMPITGKWRCHWNEGDDYEYVDLGPCDVVSFPPGLQRRFSCIEAPEGETESVMLLVIGGKNPQAAYSDDANRIIEEYDTSQQH